jgi:transposase
MVLRDHISVRKASKILNISRTTAQKWLSQAQMVEPRYPKRASVNSVLDPYKAQLAQWFKANAHRNKRERRTIKSMFEAIRAHGKRVRFFSTVEIVNLLEQEKSLGKQG